MRIVTSCTLSSVWIAINFKLLSTLIKFCTSFLHLNFIVKIYLVSNSSIQTLNNLDDFHTIFTRLKKIQIQFCKTLASQRLLLTTSSLFVS